MTVVVAAVAAVACNRADGGRPRGVREAGVRNAGVGDASLESSRAVGKPGRKTILFVGTSLTAGLGLDPEDAYPALIERRIDSLGLNYDVINAGVSGETSAGTLRRIDWLLREPVDVFVLETGANDGLRGLTVDSLRANVQAIIDRVKAKRPSARIVLVAMEAPPNLGPQYTSRFRKVYTDLARADGITLMPFLLQGVAGDAGLNQQDGVHPNVRGERIVADNVWRTLGPVLRSSG